MPTGYTANIYEGKPETFQEFALKTARAFMWFVHQRDEGSSSTPRMATVSTYTLNRLVDSKEALRKWDDSSDDDKYDQWRDYADGVEHRNAEYAKEWSERNSRYVARLAEVEAWNCPEELLPLKDYMREQLQGDMDDKPYHSKVLDFDEWVDNHRDCLVRSVKYASDDYDKSVENVKKQNEITALLYNSLGLTYGD